MAFRYSINLIRDEIGQGRAREAFQRVLIVALFIFALILAGTLVLFTYVNSQISVHQQQTKLLVQSMTKLGITVKDVKALEEKSHEVSLLLEALAKVAERTVSWSAVFADIARATENSDVRLRRLDADKLDGRDVIYVQGFSMETNPASVVDRYMEKLRAQAHFADAHLASLERDERTGESVFIITVPLKLPEVKLPSKKAGKKNNATEAD